ncbi:phage tail protein [Enterobacter cloacae complex sp.]|uniref:phage tail fiber protein n=1 Tax=Enterobacter cloacae complex sp. TaxID=2027919 RepID=UPI000D844B69|nr:phage tail protein [Enterobacter cloacae complex sp.]PYZ32328.1 phage tail protein [Enterobacter cloacae complex sp.]
MIYNTGTISINGNTATGTGTNWTAPASHVRAGQTIIVMSDPVQMFQISSVNSGTSLTVTPAASPALSGQKYGILVSDNISVDGLAQAMSQLIKEYDENIGAWETFATTSANQTITVTINGSSVNIPGIGALARKGANSDITELKGLTTALSIAQGGTGATTAEDARTNLGLGDSATKTVGTSAGNVMQVGAFGIGATNPDRSSGNSAGFISEGSGSSAWAPSTGAGVQSGYNTNRMCQMFIANNGTLYGRFNTSGDAFASPASQPWIKHYSTANTTTSSDGTLKAASPVARVVKSHEDNQRTDVAENGFIWCGCGTSNEEAEGISISRLDTGVYVLTGSAGLASEGWQLLPPMDPAGTGELGVVEAEETESGGITIRLFKRKYMLSNEGEIVKTKGEPMDVPVNSWIDVRLDMPEDSLFNHRMSQQPQH